MKFFEDEYRKNAKTKLLLHNRKLYVTCGMVPGGTMFVDLD